LIILIQIVGEVDPFFVAAFFHELPTDWDIVDRLGNIHKIQFNGLANKPLLTTGWDQLRNDFSWTEIKLLHFYYYGGKKFYMIINNNKDLEIPSFFPPFHSLSSSVGNNKTFRMQIRNEDVTATTMVSVLFFIKLLTTHSNILKNRCFITIFIYSRNILNFAILLYIDFFYQTDYWTNYRYFYQCQRTFTIQIMWTFEQCYNSGLNQKYRKWKASKVWTRLDQFLST
jgi:hypothetical protein